MGKASRLCRSGRTSLAWLQGYDLGGPIGPLSTLLPHKGRWFFCLNPCGSWLWAVLRPAGIGGGSCCACCELVDDQQVNTTHSLGSLCTSGGMLPGAARRVRYGEFILCIGRYRRHDRHGVRAPCESRSRLFSIRHWGAMQRFEFRTGVSRTVYGSQKSAGDGVHRSDGTET